MKDLEKIQSPDLGCQVADANPGNFAIEQEVGAMVGATVPAPTEPSADDARELGAQLLVFLRRALLPIRSALRTALADIYAHLDSRCTDYTPAAYAPYQPLPSYDPMGTPPTPRTLPNLLTAITAFAPRKISNGSAPNDGIKDGTTILHLLLDATLRNSIPELIDDNSGWTLNTQDSIYTLLNQFPNATKFVIGASAYTVRQWPTVNMTRNVEIWFPYITNFLSNVNFIGISDSIYGITGASLHFPSIKTLSSSSGYMIHRANGSRIYFEGLERGVMEVAGPSAYNNNRIAYIYLGCKGKTTETIRLTQYHTDNSVLNDVEIRQGARQSINVSAIGGLTAENIVNHILEKLADNSYGDPITINIGSTNLAKLTDEQKAIAQNKNYTLA